MNILIAPYKENNFRFRSDSTLIRSINDYFIPDYVTGIKLIPVMCIKAHRAGKAMEARFVERYIESFTYGIILMPSFINSNIQNIEFVKNSLDYTSIIPNHSSPINNYKNSDICFDIYSNGLKLYSDIKTPSIKEVLDKISDFSSYFSIRIGDFILFELAEAINLNKGDHITSFISGEKIIDLNIR